MLSEQLLGLLNPRQREAVLALDGPLLILAGAGSGKTRTLTFRIANLLAQGIPPHQIMAVTFTNKAAKEMKNRVDTLLPYRPANLALGTFHSIGVRLLRKEASHVGFESGFTIFDESDQVAVIREILKEMELDSTRYPPRSLLSVISSLKNLKARSGRYVPTGHFEEIASRVMHQYQKKLKEFQGMDFDDLLLETVRLFEEHADIRSRYEETFRYILVDEYQDVNYVQYRLVKLLSENHRNLCVVGDDDQSIYSFRGADVGLILRFEEDFPEAKIIRLEQNYRSTSVILDTANTVAAFNRNRKPKNLWTENTSGEKIVVYEALSEREEARFVLQEIANERRLHGRSLSDFVVLYRTNAQSRAVEEVMLQNGVPYHLVGGVRFYDRKEIKDLIAYLKVLVNPYDTLSLRRIINAPPRGVGPKTIERLEDFSKSKGENLFYALRHLDEIPDLKDKPRRALTDLVNVMAELLDLKKQNKGLTILAKTLLSKSGYLAFLEAEGDVEAMGRLENCQEFLTVAQEFEKNSSDNALETFLFHISLLSDLDTLKEGVESVTLMTLHSAKGLEFPVVFMIGLEEGIFPHSRSLLEEADIEEERRLCYVGITRAREKLFMIHAYERTLYGLTNFGESSRFLGEIPREHCEFQSQRDQSAKPSWSDFSDSSRVRLGDRLQHPVFGKGLVVQRYNEAVTVAFEGGGLRRFSTAEATSFLVGF